MRWFGGTEVATVLPDDATLLWGDCRPLWTVGDWPRCEVRTVGTQDRRLAVFGPCAASDAELADLLMEDAPRDAVHRWAGSYTVVCQDAGRTAIYTDLGWAWPIYTTRSASDVIFGSSALALAAVAGCTVDRNWLAAFMCRPDETHMLYGRSPFEGVGVIPPGSKLELTRTGRVRTEAVWKPSAHGAPQDVANALAESLTSGISVRVTPAKTVTTDLSGGLDSSSVTLLAARVASAAIHSTTLHPAGVTRGGDLDAARRAAATEPRVRHHCIALDHGALPYTDLRATPPTDEPAPSTVTFARYRAQLRVLRGLGSDCHLTGDGGDAVLTAPPAYLADLARTRRVRALLRHASGWARLYNDSSTKLVYSALRAARGPRDVAARDLTSWPGSSQAPWLTRETRSLAAELDTSAGEQYPLECAGDIAAFAGITTIGRRDRSDAQLTEHFGIPLHNPFIDSAVVHACLGVEAHQRTSPYVAKPLLRAALRGTVPEFILCRRTKGDFTSDEYLGIRANAKSLRAAFAESLLAELGLIDPAAVRTMIDRAVAGHGFDLAAFDALISAETWLRVVSDTARPRWSRRIQAGRP